MSNNIFNEEQRNYEDVHIPEELDFIVRKTLKQAKVRKYKKIMYKPIIASVAAIVIFIISVNISPTVANAVSSIPGLSRLVQLVKFDKGFDNAVSEGLAQDINFVQEKNGVKLKVTTAVGDWQRLWIGHEIEGLEKFDVSVEILDDNGEIPHGMESGNLKDNKSGYTIIFFQEFHKNFTLRYKLYKRDEERGTASLEERKEYKEAENIAVFDVPINLDSNIFNSPLREIEVTDTTLETSIGNIKVKRLETSKTRIGIYFQLESNKYDFMSFKNPRLVDNKGNIYELSNFYMSGLNTDGFHRIEMQGEIKDDVKSLELQFDGIYYAPKNERTLILDLKNRKVEPNYYGFTIDSMNDNSIVLAAKGVEIVSINDVLDNNDKVILRCEGVSARSDEISNEVKVYLDLYDFEIDKIQVDIPWILKDKAPGGQIKLINR